MNNIAIIPARSGSKGLPDKNIMEMNGKPLMYYTIKAALESGCFEEVMVSTDSEKYAQIARECGANVPFLRTPEMSTDNAGSWDAVREVLNMYNNTGKQYSYVALLQPTSPLRDSLDIKNAFRTLKDKIATNVVSVVEVEHPVQWCFRLSENQTMDEMASSPYGSMRRQELEQYYRENGAIYLVDAGKIMSTNYNLYEDNCVGYVMDRSKSVDIDTKLDLIIAEQIMQYNKLRQS